MWDWFSAWPVWVQWSIGLPPGLYLLGLVTIFFEPSAASVTGEHKCGCLFGPLFLGFVVAGYLAAIYGCTLLIAVYVNFVLGVLLGLPLGMFLFTQILFMVPTPFNEIIRKMINR